MCGRYALAMRPREVRQHLQENDMPSQEEIPDDDDVRHTYNFAPSNFGLVYRAAVPDHGAGHHRSELDGEQDDGHGAPSAAGTQNASNDQTPTQEATQSTNEPSGPAAPQGTISTATTDSEATQPSTPPPTTQSTQSTQTSQTTPTTRTSASQSATTPAQETTSTQPSSPSSPTPSQTTSYKLQAMKWGLIPFWTKRPPDYGSTMRTINCRDDSLAQSGGMWNTMKQKKRCVVTAQGFYEWLKKPGGVKVPHYVKRKDGKMMCFAGLWDCAKYDDAAEKLYTYTIVTTSSSPRLSFLHDRMPVILDPGSDSLKAWLSPQQSTWTKELQSLLKPYEGELECYPVAPEVGKVGNNSPNFIVPIDSKENPNNIANFFGGKSKAATTTPKSTGNTADPETQDNRATTEASLESEDNAPKPMPESAAGTKHNLNDIEQSSEPSSKGANGESSTKAARVDESPGKPSAKSASRPMRSATKNSSPLKSKSPAKAQNGSKKITNFFGT